MSAINDCCSPCAVPQTVNVPGPPGGNGVDGTNGVNSFSTIASFQGIGFIVPAVGSSATIYLQDTGEWMGLGQPVFVQSAGLYTVSAIASSGPNGVSVQLLNTGASGNALPGASISSGNTISPSGLPGGNSYTVTTAVFNIPAVNATATLTCASVAWMINGEWIFIQNAGFFVVNSNPNVAAGTVTVLNVGAANTATSGSVAPGAGVGPSGTQGSLPLPAPQTFYTNSLSSNLSNSSTNVGSAKVTLPAAGTWLLLGRVAGQIAWSTGMANNLIQTNAQFQTQPGGAGGFSPVLTSITSPWSPLSPFNQDTTGFNYSLPAAIYVTATIGDVIAMFQSWLQSTGSNNFTVTINEISIVAVCVNLTT